MYTNSPSDNLLGKKLSKQAAIQLLAFVCVSCCVSIHYTCSLGGNFGLVVNKSVRIVKLILQHLYHKHGFLSMQYSKLQFKYVSPWYCQQCFNKLTNIRNTYSYAVSVFSCSNFHITISTLCSLQHLINCTLLCVYVIEDKRQEVPELFEVEVMVGYQLCHRLVEPVCLSGGKELLDDQQ